MPDTNDPCSHENVNNHLAWIRTRMAAERTLESWIRTASALIAFGFAIVQFFDRLNQMQEVVPPRNPHLSRNIGLALIAIGTTALGIAIMQYQKLVNYLRSEPFHSIARIKGMRNLYSSLIVAIFLCLVGLLCIGIIIARMPVR
ncbi:YidH family protein [Pedosphaera parvula]|uniref:DUF202 domain-containing protein n=1 Tax=Pedosphaera parvula (strain Ellin514) TaxID=320771 RepID=B9XMV1_PEDPL|nr:DUF202 domain-containing protein [Pedosphaera parvula]EEF58876.1 protein of unknown function DUF202 [Pedosphaera parvula Ellin514]